jgi:hypothetical protein
MLSARLIPRRAGLIGIGAVLLVLVVAPGVQIANADDSCDVGSIIPAFDSYSYSTLPFCDGDAVIVPTSPSEPYGYTSVGNTPFVNGQPQASPYSNVSTYTTRQAAEQRANGNLSATANAYSQYGGFTAPAKSATEESSPSYVVRGY